MRRVDHKLDGMGFVPEFYVADKFDRVFAGYRNGDFYFSEDYDEARTLNHPEQFEMLKRYSSGLEIYIFYL